MVACTEALPFLRSNLTMEMSSWGSTSTTSRWSTSLLWLPSLIESRGVKMHGFTSTNWLISLRFVLLKLLHSILKCLSTDSAKSSALFALVLVVFLSNFSVG